MASAPATTPPTDDAELLFAGVERQAQLVRDGAVSARELTEASLRRIAALEPRLRAFARVLDEAALAEADERDRRRAAGEQLPLHGVPIAVKDDTDVAGAPTSWGTRRIAPPAAADAEQVRRLRAAGAVIVGKTTIPELTTTGFTETPAFGATRNPWDLEHTPGGSSGGSAAAVAAGMVAAATATDGLGSIRIPAAFCGLVGLKPQRGRLSLAPLRDRWHGLLVTGYLTRGVRDSARLLDLTAGSLPSDALRARSPAEPYRDVLERPPGRLRIAVSTRGPRELPPGRLAPSVRRALDATAAQLRAAGHDVFDADPPDVPLLVSDAVLRYLGSFPDDARNFAPGTRLAPRTRSMVRIGRAIPRALQARVRAGAPARIERHLAFWRTTADVLLTPTTRAPALTIGRFDGAGGLRTLLGSAVRCPYTELYNLTGQPAISIPSGSAEPLPVGMQLIGPPDGEGMLLALAAQLEASAGWLERRPQI